MTFHEKINFAIFFVDKILCGQNFTVFIIEFTGNQ